MFDSSTATIRPCWLPTRVVAMVAAACLLTSGSGTASAQNAPGYVILPLSLVDRANQATVRMTVNGRSTMLVLDTGASGTLLDADFYNSARGNASNFHPAELPPNLPKKVTANGEKAEVGYIDSLKAGTMELGKALVYVSAMPSGTRRYNAAHPDAAIGGLMGEDYLHKYAVIIDWGRRGVYFNTDPSKRLKPGPGLTAAGWTAVPMAVTNGRHFTVQCTIKDKPYRLLVDTGAEFTAFASGIVQLPMRYGLAAGSSMSRLTPLTGTVQMIGLDSNIYVAEADHWKIGNYEIASSTVGMQHFPPNILKQQSAGEGPILGVLGSELLRKNHAIIDIAGATLYLKPN